MSKMTEAGSNSPESDEKRKSGGEEEHVDLSRRRLLKMEGAREAVRELPGKARAAVEEETEEAAEAGREGAEKAADFAGEQLSRLAPAPGSAERAGRAAGKAVREAGDWEA